MNEVLEHQLCLNGGRVVTIVRPSYGTQSDSWSGDLYVHDDKYPIVFQVSSNFSATIFTVEDVVKIEASPVAAVNPIIYLKGPLDYAKHSVSVTA